MTAKVEQFYSTTKLYPIYFATKCKADIQVHQIPHQAP